VWAFHQCANHRFHLWNARAKMRKAAPVLDTAEKQGVATMKPHRACVEDAIDRIRPIFSAKYGVAGMPSK